MEGAQAERWQWPRKGKARVKAKVNEVIGAVNSAIAWSVVRNGRSMQKFEVDQNEEGECRAESVKDGSRLVGARKRPRMTG